MGHILNSDLILHLDIERRGFSTGGAGGGGRGRGGRHRRRYCRWLDNRPLLQLGCACLAALRHFTFDLCLCLLFAGSWTPAKDGPGCWHCRWDLFATAWAVNVKMRWNEAESSGSEVEWGWIKRKWGGMRLNQEEMRWNEAESSGDEVEWGWIKWKWGWLWLNQVKMRWSEAESNGNEAEWG